MKLLIIRHADPDYSIDSLTQKGWHEAELLAKRIANLDVKAYYMSPLGRAQDTASVTLKAVARTAEILPWLTEFHAPITKPGAEKTSIPWDFLPEVWTKEKAYYNKDQWHTTKIMTEGHVKAAADWVAEGLDALLENHGYVRKEDYYQAVQPNSDTIVLFCHFGVQCVMLGHLLGLSPMVLWHSLCAAPASITTVVTEERREGVALFRMLSFGDTAHLYVENESPAIAGRFCECFSHEDERHD